MLTKKTCIFIFLFYTGQLLIANVPEEKPKAPKRSQPIAIVTEPSVKKIKSETLTPTINEKDIENEQIRSNFSVDSPES